MTPLTELDLAAIRQIIQQELSRAAPVPPSPLPLKLTVAQFAHCVQRSRYTVRERIREDRKLRAHCQGRTRILIHPAALALFGVDPGLAAARLKEPVGKL